MESKRSRVRHAFDDGGRLSTAFRRIVAKMPSRLTRDGSLNLCERCKRIDLDGIFNSPVLFEDFQHSEMVLTLGILDKDSPCALCRFFYSMRRPSLTSETTGLYRLGRHPFNQHRFERLYGRIGAHGAKTSTTWAVDPDSEYLDPDREHMNDRPYLFFLPQSTKPCPHPAVTPKPQGTPIFEKTVNYSLLRHWIKECEGHRDCNCLSSDVIKSHIGPTIRVIDCATRHIVALQPGDRYITLSYVWGTQPLLENKGSRVLPTNVPKVIKDAMLVVKKLGQQYLWVDQYCIDQHDDRDKHAHIKNMDRIYEGSHATIVAFSGVDSSSGLPGVSSIPRIPQPRFTSSKMTLLGFTPSITRQSFEASIWMKRGWTFQEALLSRRLLIFTLEQVHFLCSRGWWVESNTPGPCMTYEFQLRDSSDAQISYQTLEAMKSISPLARLPSKQPRLQVKADFKPFLNLLERFTWRQLSFQSDALDAVRGLLSRVSILSYWGIPVYNLQGNRRGDLTIGPLKANAVFLHCLFWQPADTATDAEYLGRREGFPSWSWLGWRMPVTFWYDIIVPKFMRSTVEVENADGTLLSFSDLAELYGSEMERSRMLPERTTYLWLEGLVLTLGFQPGSSHHCGELYFCVDHPLGCSDYMTEGSCAPKCEDTRVKVSFRLNVKGSEEIWRTTLVKKWSCLWIHSSNGRHHFLILDEGDDAAYCVGTFCSPVFKDDEDRIDKLKAKVPHEHRKVRIG